MSSAKLTQPQPAGRDRISSAREAILQALGLLEQENEEVRGTNNKLLQEVDGLRQENQWLRQELNQFKVDIQTSKQHVDKLEAQNKELQQDYKQQTLNYEEEKAMCKDAKRQLSEEVARFMQTMEARDKEATERQNLIKRLERELDALRSKLERSARKNYSDRDMELLHQVDMLRAEKKEMSVDKDQLQGVNKKLRDDISNLTVTLQQKDAELKNENRRHSLLTKEFNSLLDENNKLKMQMRKKNMMKSSLHSQSTESLQKLEATATTQPNSSRPSAPNPALSREPSLIINNEVFQPTHDYPLSNLERRKLNRPSTNIAGKEPILLKRQSSNRDFTTFTSSRPSAARMGERTMSRGEDRAKSLPALTKQKSNSQLNLANQTQTFNV